MMGAPKHTKDSVRITLWKIFSSADSEKQKFWWRSRTAFHSWWNSFLNNICLWNILLFFRTDQLLNALPTLFACADIQNARAHAISSRDTEACVGWVHGPIGKHLARGTEAVTGDPLHCHILLIQSVQRPWKQSQMLVNVCRHKSIL